MEDEHLCAGWAGVCVTESPSHGAVAHSSPEPQLLRCTVKMLVESNTLGLLYFFSNQSPVHQHASDFQRLPCWFCLLGVDLKDCLTVLMSQHCGGLASDLS